MAVFIPIHGVKSENVTDEPPQTGHSQRRQLTVFTASALSSLSPQVWRGQSVGRGRKRACPIKTELGFNGELQGASTSQKTKIPRPPNAFMLFANDYRRRLAQQFPKESNKDISIRLGGMWKNMEKETKEMYFQYARQVDAAHKKKYPDYVYNPKEARIRKALREQSRGERQGAVTGASGPRGCGPSSWGKPRQIMNHRQPMMVGEQQICRDECKSEIGGGGMLQNFNDYLSDISYPGAQTGEYIVPDLVDQSWYPYVPGQVQNGPAYVMRQPSEKVLPSSEWGSQFGTDNAAFIHTNSHGTAEDANVGYLGTVTNARDHQQQLVNGGGHAHTVPPQQAPSMAPEEEVSEEQSRTTDIKMPDCVLGSCTDDGKSLLSLTQIKIERQNGLETSNGKDGLRLPGFHQAFGSTEIGRFSQHEEFFETTLPQPEAQSEKVSTPPQQGSKRTRNPRGPRKNKARSDPADKMSWHQESSMQYSGSMKKDPWGEMNGMSPMMPPMGVQQRNNCYYPMEDQNFGGWNSAPQHQMMQDHNPYYYPSYQHQQNQHQYCSQPYFNSMQQETPIPPSNLPPSRNYQSDYNDFYPPYSHSWRNHPYYNQHHFPHQNMCHLNQQYNDYRHCSTSMNYPPNHPRGWGMNREFKLHSYSSGLV